VLIASSEEKLKKLVTRLHGAANMTGMKINGKKTELMKVSDNPTLMKVTVAGVPWQKPSRSNIWKLCSKLCSTR